VLSSLTNTGGQPNAVVVIQPGMQVRAVVVVDSAGNPVILSGGGGIGEPLYTSNSASGTVALNPSDYSVSAVTMTGDVTFTFGSVSSADAWSFALYLFENGTGGYTATFPGSVTWIGGTEPTLATAPSALNILVFETVDGGATWYGSAVTGAPSLPLTVADGGTGGAELGAYQVLIGGITSTSPVQVVSGTGTAGQVLTSNGPGSAPTWQNA
jgi:hypothetical protein